MVSNGSRITQRILGVVILPITLIGSVVQTSIVPEVDKVAVGLYDERARLRFLNQTYIEFKYMVIVDDHIMYGRHRYRLQILVIIKSI